VVTQMAVATELQGRDRAGLVAPPPVGAVRHATLVLKSLQADGLQAVAPAQERDRLMAHLAAVAQAGALARDGTVVAAVADVWERYGLPLSSSMLESAAAACGFE